MMFFGGREIKKVQIPGFRWFQLHLQFFAFIYFILQNEETPQEK